MVNWQSKKLTDLLLLANGIAALVLLNLLASYFFFRIDLTEEKRFSVKDQTKEILQNLDDKVYVEVYLEGDLNAGFTRFRNSIRELLDEFRVHSGNKLSYRFINPGEAQSEKARNEFMSELAAKGIQPTNIIDTRNGQRIEKIVFPGAVVSYGGDEQGVMLLKSNKTGTADEKINQSIEGLEFEIANTIYQLTNAERKQVGLVKGHGELDSLSIAGLVDALHDVYDVFNVSLSNPSLTDFDVLIVAKPTRPFSETDKFLLDQYIMNGGKVMMFVDRLEANMDSIAYQDYFAFPYNINLDDQLFRYGVRINFDLIQDRNSGFYPVVVGRSGNKPDIQLVQWPFFPLINRYAEHPMTRNLDAVIAQFASSIDTVKAAGIKKTPIMFTSESSRTITAPVNINVNDLRKDPSQESYEQSYLPVGYLLEGEFTSLYKNRFPPEEVGQRTIKETSEKTKLIIVSDGDVIKNQINPRTRQPQALGFDQFTNTTFGNKDLVLNMLAYLTEEDGLIHARTREVMIRPLDRERIRNERTKWQLINLLLPLVLLISYGVARSYFRKRKYASFQ
jgi:ABC-2 type transport system permease protein